jgi:hypothetical protein
MNLKLKYVLASGAVAILAVLGLASVAAASSYFSGTVQTADATSTVAYMTPGTATSTLTYNTYTNTNVATATPSTTNYSAATSVTLLGQLTGSSTATVLHITPEYSQNGLDWYQGYGLLPQYSATTTNQTLSWATVDSITIAYASTTVDQTSTSSIDRFAVTIAVPTKDVRLVFTLTGANGAFWGQVIPTKQN